VKKKKKKKKKKLNRTRSLHIGWLEAWTCIQESLGT